MPARTTRPNVMRAPLPEPCVSSGSVSGLSLEGTGHAPEPRGPRGGTQGARLGSWPSGTPGLRARPSRVCPASDRDGVAHDAPRTADEGTADDEVAQRPLRRAGDA